jgi:hypothetical protein
MGEYTIIDAEPLTPPIVAVTVYDPLLPLEIKVEVLPVPLIIPPPLTVHVALDVSMSPSYWS